MWTITEDLPFAAERGWVRDRSGAEVWLVVVRGTFEIDSNGATHPAAKQRPVVRTPIYRDDPVRTSLMHDTDLVPIKTATDVLLLGHAYAPGGQPVSSTDVTVKAGPINKTLRVTGDRKFRESITGLAASSPEPFLKMPITYERTWGGTDRLTHDANTVAFDSRNPVGVGFATRQNRLIGSPAPNVEYTDRSKTPAGFGPIAPHWAPRVSFAGTYDDRWEKQRLPLLPDDFDDRFYQCAPKDQQVPGFLRGGELVELYNLTPEGTLRFRLPRVTFGFETIFQNRESELHRQQLHSVVLEPDVRQVTLVWQTSLPCHHHVSQLTGTEITIKQPVNVSDEDRANGVWTGAIEVEP